MLSGLIIETSRLLLRPFELSDAEAVCRLGLENNKATFLPDWAHDGESAAGLIRYFRECMENPGPRKGPVAWAVVLKETGELIGHAGIGPKEELGGEVELGYAVSERYAGRGLATEAARAAVWWAFERAGLPFLAAIVLPENAASIKVLEKIGFVPAGRRTMEHGGREREFEYYRFYRLDRLQEPEWEGKESEAPEPMAGFFDNRAGSYEAHMREDPDFDGFYAAAVEPIAATDGPIEVLDLGCGTGLELKGLFERAPHARVTCVDISTGMLDKLRGTYRDKLGQLNIVQASYADWPYPAAAFDYVISVYTMHHFFEREKVEIYRKILSALKPGGVYVEADFIVDQAMMEQYRRRYNRILAQQSEAKPQLHVDIPFTVELQAQLLKEAGFSSARLCHDSVKPEHSGAVLAAAKAAR